MKKYCSGCGVLMQDDNILGLGFTTNLENDMCMRCFRLKNYGEYESVSSSLVDYQGIIDGINKTNDLVLYVVDILNLPNNLQDIREMVSNDCILVLNKRDLIPLSVKEEKIIEYLNNLHLGYDDIVIVSSEKNTNMDLLLRKIERLKKSNNVYVIGYTNAGKSSLINKFIKNYGDGDTKLTIAPLPSTTLDKIIIPINDSLTLVDTPGIIDKDNIINFVDSKLYKKLNSKKEIKPKTYQLSKNESLLIGDLMRIDYVEGDRNSLTFYIPNEIKIRRCRFKSNNLKNLSLRSLDVEYYSDVVIRGLGFIKIVAGCKINIYINKDVLVFTRKNMI
jgi:ribosome biogenesis GTPase YqeH